MTQRYSTRQQDGTETQWLLLLTDLRLTHIFKGYKNIRVPRNLTLTSRTFSGMGLWTGPAILCRSGTTLIIGTSRQELCQSREQKRRSQQRLLAAFLSRRRACQTRLAEIMTAEYGDAVYVTKRYNGMLQLRSRVQELSQRDTARIELLRCCVYHLIQDPAERQHAGLHSLSWAGKAAFLTSASVS